MNPYVLLYLDNDPTAIESFKNELEPLTTHFDLFCIRSLNEAELLMAEIQQQKQTVAMIVTTSDTPLFGAEFITKAVKLSHCQNARTILICEKNDTMPIITAINEGHLNYCLIRPFDTGALLETATRELTTFILSLKQEDWLHYSSVLDQSRILSAHIEQRVGSYQPGFIHDFHELSDSYLADKVIGSLLHFFSEKDETNACRTYSPDHLLTVEGEPNRFLWFIVEGEVALYKTDDTGIQREVVRHTKGNIVGGMSFVTGERSFSTGVTLTRTKVIKLDKGVFSQVMHSNSELLPLFTNLLLRHFNRRLQRSICTKMELQKTLESLENAHQQLIDREKMAMLGQLVAGVAHELNNPVAAILRGADTLTTRLDELIHSPLPESHQELGTHILRRAMHSRPMSTSDIRQKSKDILTQVGDRQLAKKIVQLGLHKDLQEILLLSRENQSLSNTVNGLEKYHITGSTLRSIQVCAKRIADMVKSLKGYARPDDEKMHKVDIHEGIEDTLVIFENRLKLHQVIKEYQPLPEILCLPIALQQVWTNLISNAIDAFPEKGCLKISTETARKHAKNFARIIFEDNGHGIPEEKRKQIFELNYTTKKEGNFGLGIGLSVCQQIMAQHGGWIEVESNPEEYTRMIVWLPFEQNNPIHLTNPNKEK